MKHKITLVVIVLLAFFLRFIGLGYMPNSYTPDELAQAYTAHSILETGKDEWGSTNILSLRSFGDYKPPVQTLLMIPSVKFFGLTPFAARLPNAVFSVLTVFLVYLISQKLFKNKTLSLIAATFFALSPWSLPMSRIALEANLVIFIISLAFYLFLSFLDNKNIFILALSSLFFGISLFTYHSAKLFIPLFLVVLFFYSKLYKKILPLFVFFTVFFALFGFNFYINSLIKTSRTSDIAIFNPTDNWRGVSDTQYEITKSGIPYFVTKIFYNKIVYLSDTFLTSYLSYFSPQFLVTSGAGETTYGMLPGFGVLGIIPTFGFVLSIFLLVKGKLKNDQKPIIFLLIVILLGPVAASIAKGSYSANRASLMMPFIQIFSAAGIYFGLKQISHFQKFSKLITLTLLVVFFYTTGVFLQRYYFQGNQILAKGMLFGRKEISDYIKSNPEVDKIIYSRKLSEPQAYAAFFDQIDPKITQAESVNWMAYDEKKLSFLDQLGEYNLGKFTFKEINFRSDSQQNNAILIGKPDEFLDVTPDKIIYYPSVLNQEPAVYIYNTKK